MVAVFLLTGERYWRGGSLLEVLTQLNAGPTFAPSSRWPHLSSAFDEWFWRSCDRVGARRYASAAAQLSALARVMPTLRAAPAPKSAATTSEDRTMAIYPAQLRALPRPRAIFDNARFHERHPGVRVVDDLDGVRALLRMAPSDAGTS